MRSPKFTPPFATREKWQSFQETFHRGDGIGSNVISKMRFLRLLTPPPKKKDRPSNMKYDFFPLKTNKSPEQEAFQKEKKVFQASIFRGINSWVFGGSELGQISGIRWVFLHPHFEPCQGEFWVTCQQTLCILGLFGKMDGEIWVTGSLVSLFLFQKYLCGWEQTSLGFYRFVTFIGLVGNNVSCTSITIVTLTKNIRNGMMNRLSKSISWMSLGTNMSLSGRAGSGPLLARSKIHGIHERWERDLWF